MSRRIRPSAAPTVRIPRQRGGQPVIVVLGPEQEPTLTARAVAASGRWLWKHRRTWAPTGLAVVLLAVTGLVHLIEPRTAWVLAPIRCLRPELRPRAPERPVHGVGARSGK
ncbi:hypothetical protein ACGFNX_31110 [Streptomyces sp. NPDC048723]|uniref:hypothetical protein n=1 Tax=Streptomyces sp. NPDC048723 TaxID=3365589 RepID=UPI00371B79E7